MKELKGCRKFDVPENDNKSNYYLKYANTSKTKNYRNIQLLWKRRKLRQMEINMIV